MTSVNDNEARNMGRGEAVDGARSTRYDRADEFMEIVLGHWDSWDDDAIVVDKVKQRLRHRPDKVRRIDYQGEVPFITRDRLPCHARRKVIRSSCKPA